MVGKIFFVAILIISLGSCSLDPEPIAYGKDLCHFCKMGIIEKGFASEIVTKKGKVYKFDDLGCMVNTLKSGDLDQNTLAHVVVIQHNTEQEFVEVNDAVFLKASKIKSPMNFNYACYKSKDIIPASLMDSSAVFLKWNEVFQQIGK